CSKWLVLGQIVVAVTYKDIELDDVLHATTCLGHHCFEVTQHLLELCHYIAGCNDAPLGVAGVLPRQEEQLATGDEDAVVEATRLRKRWRRNNRLRHMCATSPSTAAFAWL